MAGVGTTAMDRGGRGTLQLLCHPLVLLYVCAAVLQLQQAWLVSATATQLPWGGACPAACSCYTSPGGALTVHCPPSSGALTEIPTAELPTQVQYLILRGQRVSQLADQDLVNLTLLRTLDLSTNAISNISRSAFTHTPSLQTLLLSHNLLELVPASVFTPPGLHTLDLSNNNISAVEFPASPSSQAVQNLTSLDLSFNVLTEIPDGILGMLPNLQSLDLRGNNITKVSSTAFHMATANETHPLEYLSLAHNAISFMDPSALNSLSNLQSLDVSYNALHGASAQWLETLADLEYFSLSHNPLLALPNFMFANASSLQTLDLSHLHNLSYVARDTLAGLGSLQQLNLSHNPSLEFIHALAFLDLQHLRQLDLSDNALSSLHPVTLQNLTSLESVGLGGNMWSCDCEAVWLSQWVVEAESSGLLQQDVVCASPAVHSGQHLRDIPLHNLTCVPATILNHTELALVTIGSAVVLDCAVGGNPRPAITWRTNRGQLLHYQPAFVDFSDIYPEHQHYHSDHDWHLTDRYMHEVAVHFHERIQVLRNGSLYIDYITRRDGGNFTCFAENEMGNDTVKVLVKLDYSLITNVKIASIICGFICAVTFFVLTVVTSAIRFVVFFFSEKEKKKRRSIREVLEDIHNYKSSKVEQLSAYKSAKLGQLSAFKTAKIDQLTAFKLAKVEKLSAYKSAKIDKIRTYKQATVTNVLHHLHNMREYYTSQMCRIKDNCSQQVDRLRDNYSCQMVKFKDYRSHHIDKIRENYHSQAVRIRDYSSLQMARLREQYKTQQLHILKLLELLDVGNCMTVIEAECMRTESMIFDPDITFDLDAHPVHIPCELEESGDSEYLTAGTTSDISSVASAPYILSIQNENGLDPLDPMGQMLPSPGPSHLREAAKPRKKKRHKRRPPEGIPVDLSCDSLAEPPPLEVDIAQVHKHRAPPKSLPPPSLALGASASASPGKRSQRESSPGQESSTSADYVSAQASRDQSPEEAVLRPGEPAPAKISPTDGEDEDDLSQDQVVVALRGSNSSTSPRPTEDSSEDPEQAKETTV